MPTAPPGEDTIAALLNLLLLVLLVAATISTILAPVRRRREAKPKVYTRVECVKCGYAYTRPYQRGDYAGKSVGKCPKCGAEMIITGVYEELPPEAKRAAEKRV